MLYEVITPRLQWSPDGTHLAFGGNIPADDKGYLLLSLDTDSGVVTELSDGIFPVVGTADVIAWGVITSYSIHYTKLYDETFTMNDYAGKVVLVETMAIWCPRITSYNVCYTKLLRCRLHLLTRPG